MAKKPLHDAEHGSSAANGTTGDLFARPKAVYKPRKPKALIADNTKLGVKIPAEWLLICPARYVDYANDLTEFGSLAVGTSCVLQGTVVDFQYFRKGSSEPLQRNEWTDATRLVVTLTSLKNERLDVQVFGKPYYTWRNLAVGSVIRVRGTPKLNYKAQLELQSAELVLKNLAGKIQPVYPSVRQTKGATIGEYVAKNMHLISDAAAIVESATGWSDPASPISYPELTKFDSPLAFLLALHSPKTMDEAHLAQRASKRVSAFALVRSTYTRHASRPVSHRSSISVTEARLDDLIAKIPFKLTSDQHQVIRAIGRCLSEPIAMQGLLTGDVGTGKTLAYLIPAVAAYEQGARVIIMTPNLPLITALGRQIKDYFPFVKVATIAGDGVTGDTDGSLLIGSTALLGALAKGKIPGHADFLIVDEQHKFSIEQRSVLAREHTNVLEATATPVPRTAALITHGGSDVFTLRERPYRRDVATSVHTRSTALIARNAILEAVLQRREQAAVVYPLVSTDDEEKARTAVTSAIDNWKKYVPEDRIAVLHGKLRPEEKQAVIDSMSNNECDLLITSTVIEVGLTLPNLRTMLVVNADRMGVVTLHQLRGRLSRHGGHADMMLYCPEPTPEALARMTLLSQHEDGFVLAEKDAEIRGFGDLLGTDGDTQSGKTRTLFLGVEIGPREIAFAADRYQAVLARMRSQSGLSGFTNAHPLERHVDEGVVEQELVSSDDVQDDRRRFLLR